MKRLWMLLIAALLVLATVPVTAQSNSWTAEYYNNPSLFGAPVLVRTEAQPGGRWGFSTPAPGVVADNFSARWSTSTFINAGTYRITVRADDGVRVIVNGVVVIDQFALATGRSYSADVPLPAGTATIVVEYFEAFEVAFLEYDFTQVSGPGPVPGLPSATVSAFRLNVRSGPSVNFPAITQISRGQTYPVIGRNAASSWLQLDIGGVIGWVSRPYVQTGDLSSVPITDGGTVITPVPNATITVATGRLNVRAQPNPFTGTILTTIVNGATYPLIGRNADNSWLQITVGGITGWVRSSYVRATNLNSVPVTNPGTNPAQPSNAFATVTAYFLNVRSGPAAGFPRLTVIARGQTYPVIGRNAAGTWVQLNVNGTVGWVNRGFVTVTSLNVPVTS